MADLLERLRRSRGFDADEVLEAKLGRLARFFRESGLDAAVVGVSGGVDSALVLAMLRAVQRRGGIRRVVALLLPIEGRGATGQSEATRRGRLVVRALGAEAWEAPLGKAHAELVASVSRGADLPFDAWAEGQALSVLRTPALYGAAALLQAHGFRSLVVGTTNRDEGSYLGFFGKGSDGMVDLQPISDLHKSEVRALARLLAVPAEIIEAAPRGDVHDGRTDEEMLGASYDEVELYLRLRELGLEALAPEPARRALEAQHARNAHKYRVGNPAVHLDILPRGVPGGWPDEVLSPRTETRPPPSVVPGAWDPPVIALDDRTALPEVTSLALEGLGLVAHGVLTAADCARLRAAMEAHGHAEPVGVTGIKDSHGVGSMRATAFCPELAGRLWQRLAGAVPAARFTGERTPTEGFATSRRDGHRSWRVVGLSPLLRFMRYEPGGRHLTHYDAGHDYGDGRRSLLSVVFYLTAAQTSGATRFVRDGQEGTPVATRDFADWSRDARADEIALRVLPEEGSALVFDHRMAHDVERWDGPGARVIVRADVVYEAIPDGRGG